MFIKSIGMEVPAKYNNSYVGLNYVNKYSNDSRLTFRINYSLDQLKKFQNIFDLNFGYNFNNFHFSLENSFNLFNSSILLGLGFDKLLLVTNDYIINDLKHNRYVIFGNSQYNQNINFQHNINMMCTFANNKFAFKTSYIGSFIKRLKLPLNTGVYVFL